MAISTSKADLPDTVNVVSSANILDDEYFKLFGKSLIYTKNKSGPRIEPWGIAHVIFSVL